jgi:hypothetical protein
MEWVDLMSGRRWRASINSPPAWRCADPGDMWMSAG